MKAAFQLLILSDNSNEKTHYTYYGRKKLKVLFTEIQHSLKRWYREKYIDKNFLRQIPDELSFIFLPLQQEPERSLLIGAPDYVNQIKTVEYVSKCIPKNYLLFVKEHPTQGPGRGWRKISDYQTMQNNPKVRLVHPSIPANEIIAKSKLVISVSGTLALESAFFNKPSITFADNDYTLISSISRLESKNELRGLIEDSLDKKIEPSYVGKYFDILEENSFVFDYLGFQVSYLKHFYFDGNLVDIEIDESGMLKFLLDHEKSFSVLIEQFKQKIN
jgi:CDP-glycerol glycerophosphotransferase (TagB/SpsB family)